MANPTTVVINLTGSDKTGAAWASANKRVANHRRKVKGLLGTYQRIKTNIVQMNSALGLMPVAGMAGMAASAALFAKSVLSARTEMNSFNNSMLVATGSSKAGAKEFKKVTKLSRKLGLDLGTTADSYRKFSISARAAGLSQRDTSSVFEGVSTAIGAIGLSSEKSSRVFMALEQMMSKGTVSAEELKQQMGEHLPGSMSIAAKAMGMTTREFQKALAAGRIMSDDFLPKFATALKEKFGEAAIKASTQFRGAFNNMSSAWLEFQLAVGDKKFMDAATKAVTKLTSILKDPATIKGVRDAFSALIDGFTWILDNGERVATVFRDIAVSLLPFGVVFKTAVRAVTALREALISLTETKTGNKLWDDSNLAAQKERIDETTASIAKLQALIDGGLKGSTSRKGRRLAAGYEGAKIRLQELVDKLKEYKALYATLSGDVAQTKSSSAAVIDEEDILDLDNYLFKLDKVNAQVTELFSTERGADLINAFTAAREAAAKLQKDFDEETVNTTGTPTEGGMLAVMSPEEVEKLTEMQEGLALLKEDLEGMNELSLSFGATWMEMAEGVLPIWQEIGQTLAEIFGPDGVLINGLAEAASSAILFGTSFSDSMQNLAKTIASTVLTMLIKVGLQEAFLLGKKLLSIKIETAAEIAASAAKATAATTAATTTAGVIGAEMVALGAAAAPAAALYPLRQGYCSHML